MRRSGPRNYRLAAEYGEPVGQQKLDGQGETVRETVLSTVLTARVTHVLPNGNLVIEGAKSVTVNSETQRVIVRGVVRPFDLSTANAVRSDQIAMLEVSVAGRVWSAMRYADPTSSIDCCLAYSRSKLS